MHKPLGSVGIIGGGLAGMSAAALLAERGVRVELFERRDRLGGRAGAFWAPTVGQWIDFGQHVLMGCCKEMLHFCRQTGLDRFLRRYQQISFLDPEGQTYHLQGACWLPAPLHLLPAFLRLGFLSWQDRLKTAWGLARLVRDASQPEDRSFGDWLRQQGQTSAAVEKFWTPVVLGALADLPERTAFSTARKVFLEGFLTSRDAYHLVRPTTAWGQLLDAHLGQRLAHEGVQIHRRTPVRLIDGDNRQVHGLVLKNGSRKKFDFYILAVPWRRAAGLLAPNLLETIPNLVQAALLEPGAITTWHLWLDRPITELPQLAVVGKAIQWVFADIRGESSGAVVPSEGKADLPGPFCTPCGGEQDLLLDENNQMNSPNDHPTPRSVPPKGENRGCYYQVILSGTHALPKSLIPQTAEEVFRELTEIFPAAKEAKLLFYRRVCMVEAVFSPRPGVEKIRPGQKTPILNLALAGDWTATGWPATMEGAVRSGYQAAKIALEHGGL